MSYCRFTEGDVYAYECDGGVQFWTAGEGLNRLCNTFNDAYQYAMFLRDGYGLDVPSHAIEALKADAIEEAARICGPDSAIAELAAENTKLRELVCWMYDRMDESCAVQYPYAPSPISYDRLMQARARARELGVEVDE